MLFGRKNKPTSTRRIAFYIEANDFDEHGKVRVSNRRLGLRNEVVSFAMPDCTDLPEITEDLIAEIRFAAQVQGYIFHSLVKYGQVISELKMGESIQALAPHKPYVQNGVHILPLAPQTESQTILTETPSTDEEGVRLPGVLGEPLHTPVVFRTRGQAATQ